MNSADMRHLILSQKPTREQENAIFSADNSFVLRACPGSGKTWTAARRMAWRLSNWNYRVGGIALLSYTNVAVNTFKDTVTILRQYELLKDPHFIGTLDSFVERFLIGPFGYLVMRCEKRPVLHTAPSNHDRVSRATKVYYNNRLIDVWDIEPEIQNGSVVFKYQNGHQRSEIPDHACRDALNNFSRRGWYTHKHRNYWAYRILTEHTRLLQTMKLRFPEIIIDESQDTSGFHQAIFDKLMDIGILVTFIGDPDQCIYEFNQARTGYIESILQTRHLPEYRLSLNRRSNQQIINVARHFGTFRDMEGMHSTIHQGWGAFIISYGEAEITNLPTFFQQYLRDVDLSITNSAIVARGNETLEKIRGKSNHGNLQGLTKIFAESAYCRDIRKSMKMAFDFFLRGVKGLSSDTLDWDSLEGTDELDALKLSIWKFVRAQEQLPSVYMQAQEWVNTLKTHLTAFMNENSIHPSGSMGTKIRINGLNAQQKLQPLAEEIATHRAPIRIDTIHQVKGETLEALMLVEKRTYYDRVISNLNRDPLPEDVRLAYVAMTRPKHLLIIALPSEHYSRSLPFWLDLGCKPLATAPFIEERLEAQTS